MTEFQRKLNATVIHNSNTGLAVIVIVIYYIDGGSNICSNSNSNILIFKVIVIVIYYIDGGSNICSNSNSNILILF